MGVDRVLIEGGPSVIGAFMGSGLFDMLTIYIGPMLVGGNGPSFSKGLQHFDGEANLRSIGSKGLGEGLLLEYSPIR
jgi:riboflavin biosynthesis pyrimidine reductase